MKRILSAICLVALTGAAFAAGDADNKQCQKDCKEYFCDKIKDPKAREVCEKTCNEKICKDTSKGGK